MAESPSLTSEKPPIQKEDLGFLLNDAPPTDPIEEILEIQHSEASEIAPTGESDHPAALMAEETEEAVGEAAADDEEMFQSAIERELFELTIQLTEIERAFEMLESGDQDGKDSESFEDETEIEIDGDLGSKSGDGAAKFGRFNQGNNRKRVNYPMRPNAEDCSFYMKFGSCKFGLNCKFNHPPGERTRVLKTDQIIRKRTQIGLDRLNASIT